KGVKHPEADASRDGPKQTVGAELANRSCQNIYLSLNEQPQAEQHKRVDVAQACGPDPVTTLEAHRPVEYKRAAEEKCRQDSDCHETVHNFSNPERDVNSSSNSSKSKHPDESYRYKDRRQHVSDRHALDADQIQADRDNQQAAD